MESLLRDLSNPRVVIAAIPNKHHSINSSTRYDEPAPIIDMPNQKEYNNKVMRENKTKLTIISNKNGYLYSADLSNVVAKCIHNHPHLIAIGDIADGTASCPTCIAGTIFSRKIVLLMRNEFDISIFIKDPHQSAKEPIVYYNPTINLEVHCELDKNDDYFESIDNVFIIHIHSKPKERLITFLRNALNVGKKMGAEIYYPFPFTTDSAANYYGNGLIDEGLIITDRLLLFENT